MILYPKIIFNKVEEINIEFLNKNKIKALILDVDNTLINKEKVLQDSVINWARDLKGQGVKIYILSNSNKKDKIKEVAEKLNIDNFYNWALKPMKKGFKKIQKELNIESQYIGVIGDQIFTDIWGGNRCKMYTILVEPIDKNDIWITKLKRPIDDWVKNKYKEKITKEKGEF